MLGRFIIAPQLALICSDLAVLFAAPCEASEAQEFGAERMKTSILAIGRGLKNPSPLIRLRTLRLFGGSSMQLAAK